MKEHVVHHHVMIMNLRLEMVTATCVHHLQFLIPQEENVFVSRVKKTKYNQQVTIVYHALHILYLHWLRQIVLHQSVEQIKQYINRVSVKHALSFRQLHQIEKAANSFHVLTI